MRNVLATFAMGVAATVAGCAATNSYKAPPDPELTSDVVQASGDTSVTRSHATAIHKLSPHGCVGPLPVRGRGLNACSDGTQGK